jgi:hypothetical protein
MSFELESIQKKLEALESKGKAINAHQLSNVASFVQEQKGGDAEITRNLNHFSTLVSDYERASKLKEMNFHNMPVIFEPPQSDDPLKISERLVIAMSKSLHGIQAALQDGMTFHVDYLYTISPENPDFAQFIGRDLKGRAYRLATADMVRHGKSGSFSSLPDVNFNVYGLKNIESDLPGEKGEEIKAFLARLCLMSENMDIIRNPAPTKDLWYCTAAGLSVKINEGNEQELKNQYPFMMGLSHPMLNAQVKKFNPQLPLEIRDALVKQPTFGKIVKNSKELLKVLTENPNSVSSTEIVPSIVSVMAGLEVPFGSPCSKAYNDERNRKIVKAHETNFARSKNPHERLFNALLIISTFGKGFRFDTKPKYEHKKVSFYPTNVDNNTGLKRDSTLKAQSNPSPTANLSGASISSDVVFDTFMELKDQALQPEQIAFLILNELGQQTLPLTKDELKEIGGIISGMRRVPDEKIKTGAQWFSSVVEQKIEQIHCANNNTKESNHNRQPDTQRAPIQRP